MGKWNGKNPDRYLLLRKGNYHYHRRIPKQLVVDRVRFVRRSLKTSNIESAGRSAICLRLRTTCSGLPSWKVTT